MRVIFWQNIVSPHQAGFMRAMAERGHDVTVVAAEEMSSHRRMLGWQPPALGPALLVVGPSDAEVVRIIRDSDATTIHCIAGARALSLGKLVAVQCRRAGRRMGIISEAPDPRGLGGVARWAKYTCERMLIGGSFDFLLTMGETGARWFRRCGYPENRIFPFLYVTDVGHAPPRREPAGPVRFVFVGRLVRLKGVDVLLSALANTSGVELDVVGDGPEREPLTAFARRIGIDSRVRWSGQLNPEDVASRLAHADALVLPSRKDGWGAVVNEALMLGTPVICSDACGASDLVQHPWLGTVVSAGDVAMLGRALAEWAARGHATDGERRRIREWSACIDAPAIAAYLEGIFRHVYAGEARPIPPWRVRPSAGGGGRA